MAMKSPGAGPASSKVLMGNVKFALGRLIGQIERKLIKVMT